MEARGWDLLSIGRGERQVQVAADNGVVVCIRGGDSRSHEAGGGGRVVDQQWHARSPRKHVHRPRPDAPVHARMPTQERRWVSNAQAIARFPEPFGQGVTTVPPLVVGTAHREGEALVAATVCPVGRDVVGHHAVQEAASRGFPGRTWPSMPIPHSGKSIQARGREEELPAKKGLDSVSSIMWPSTWAKTGHPHNEREPRARTCRTAARPPSRSPLNRPWIRGA
jgi:hypothetical protein